MVFRDAGPADLERLIDIKSAPHADRIGDAGLRYLVAEDGDALLGFGLLVFRRPASWSDARSIEHLPQIVDLHVRPERRGEGVGTLLIREMETIVAGMGGAELFVGVDPVGNPRALALYRRLGFEPLQAEPYRLAWGLTDSCGVRHEGEGWNVDLVRRLSAGR